MFTIQLARQGQTMEQGTIVAWKKNEGDTIAVGEELYDVETEKTIVTIEATRPGTLVKILVLPGTPVPIGSVLALAADTGEVISATELEAAAKQGLNSQVTEIVGAKTEAPAVNRDKRLAVPKARLLARELNVDLSRVQG